MTTMTGTVNGRTPAQIDAQRRWAERLQIENFHQRRNVELEDGPA